MWIYRQANGQLWLGEECVGCGYSGCGVGKNNPVMEDVHNVGPIPRGRYLIGPAHDTTTHGPYVLDLTPCDVLGMHGRGGFLIHGDNRHDPGMASHGCIVLPRDIRERIGTSGIELLEVV